VAWFINIFMLVSEIDVFLAELISIYYL